MNLYAAVVVLTGLTAIGYWLWGECQHSRADRLQRELTQNVRYNKCLLAYVNSLEPRRHVICTRWWKRQGVYRRLEMPVIVRGRGR